MPTKQSPTKGKNRVEAIDALRGFAVLGILLANIMSFSGVRFLPFTEIKLWPSFETDLMIYKLIGIFVDTKFYTIFSLLFGIGFYFQFHKNRNNQAEFMPIYYRRLGFLILFGAIHSFFWSGDILMIYAFVGFLFTLFRNLKPKQLFTVSALAFMMPLLIDIFMLMWKPGFMNPEKSLALKTHLDIEPTQLVEPFMNGSFWEVTKMNWHNLLWRWFDLLPSGRPFKLLSLFILGYYLMYTGYFQEKAHSVKRLVIYSILGLGLTLLSKQVGGSMGQFPSTWNDILYKFLFSFGQINMAFAYISIITILYKTKIGENMMSGLKFAGRMSFTSYLSHTFFGILIFYPYALGYFGKITLWQAEIIAVIIFILQVYLAKLWLKYYTFGPLEWLWRSLTYGKFLSMKKEDKS
ncbi:DUF418 domain-containing protein [Lentimicrobium sp. S6]|uniref:DUF418 domain-containing protein n=1 Tax=Lentimicrobium sp. S6 TaxID=2735872 RepID=UPI00155788DC|nr:DUF418 domain-containing protein [Lentimicrobium sp. S6]NPD45367.1 DUF418 domain-containing protein [Lentimicrobium sp. S6]